MLDRFDGYDSEEYEKKMIQFVLKFNELRPFLDVIDAAITTILEEGMKISDPAKSDQFYAQTADAKKLMENLNSIQEIKETLVALVLQDDDELEEYYLSREELSKVGEQIDRVTKDLYAAMKLSQVVNIRLIAKKIEHPEIQPTVTLVHDHLDAKEPAAIPKAESVDNINRLFAKLKLERERDELVKKEVEENSVDFGVTAQL